MYASFAKSEFFRKIISLVPTCLGIIALKSKISQALQCQNFLDNSPLEQTLTKIFQKKKIQDAQKALALAAFELQSGQVTYFDKCADITVVDALMATSAIQGAFPPRVIQGKQYIDGGNGANLPIRQAIQYGCNRLIAVRASATESVLTRLFGTWYSIIERAFLTSFGNVTSQDIAKANDISFRLNKELERDARIQDIIKSTISESPLQTELSAQIAKLPPVFTDKLPIEIIEIIPDPEPMPKTILEFSPAVSRQMIDEGFQKAKEKLELLSKK